MAEQCRAMMMAMDRNKLIGRAGGLPWRIPADFRHFKQTTLDKAIIMGRRTFSEDIKRPLPRRANIVVTRDKQWRCEGVDVVHGLMEGYERASKLTPDSPECFVIGGAELCREAMPFTERLYLTVVDAEFEGDTWLDSFDFQDWHIREQRFLAAESPESWGVTFYTLDRTSSGAEKQEFIS